MSTWIVVVLSNLTILPYARRPKFSNPISLDVVMFWYFRAKENINIAGILGG
jgi:hypothetical protein